MKNPFSHIQEPQTPAIVNDWTPERLNEIKDQISQGATLQIIPKGSKGIIIKKEISEQLKIEVLDVTNQLKSLPAITSQENASKANLVLKSAKNLIKNIESERKKMDELLNAEKADNKSIEAEIVGSLSTLVQIVNKNITVFQEEEECKAQERAKELQRQRDEELAKAEAERTRVQTIKGLILKFESNVIKAMNESTIENVDEKIKQLEGYKLSESVYMEFYSEAMKSYSDALGNFRNRKNELVKYAELEKQNKEQAEQLKAQATAKAKADLEAVQAKEAVEKAKAQEQEMNDRANIQMNHELKGSLNVGAKGVQKRWTFDEESIDMVLLPEEFKTYDKDKIREAISSGKYVIPGVHIYQKTINVSR